MGIVPKAEMEPLMQMILSFLRVIVLYLLLCLTIPSIWSLKSNTKVKSLLFSLFTTCSSKHLGTKRTSFRFYYFETMYIVIDISNQESRVCSLLANIVAWEQSLEVHRHEHQLSQEGHKSNTTIHGNTLLQDNKYTQQYAIHSICNGYNFLSGTELAFHKLSAAVIFQIMICTKHCDWGTKKVRMRPPLEVKQSFCSRWEDYWQQR